MRERDPRGGVTIYSLARELGVSASTVSRAFSRPDLVKAAVREQILALAAERGFAPSRAARGLATGRTGLLGLVVLDITNPFFPPLVRAVEHAAVSLDASVLLADVGAGGQQEDALVRRLATQVDGLLLASPRMSGRVLTEAIGDTPTVLVNQTIRGMPHVVCDVSSALAQAADHLVDLGHRRLALLRGPSGSWAAPRRTAAIRSWAAAVPDVSVVELGPFEATYEAGRDAVPAVLDSGATGIVAFDDYMACGVVAGLVASGCAVPREYSVVGCDDVLLARTLTPALTTVSVPFEELGRHAVTLLADLIAGRSPDNVRLHGTLVPRGSTGPA